MSKTSNCTNAIFKISTERHSSKQRTLKVQNISEEIRIYQQDWLLHVSPKTAKPKFPKVALIYNAREKDTWESPGKVEQSHLEVMGIANRP